MPAVYKNYASDDRIISFLISNSLFLSFKSAIYNQLKPWHTSLWTTNLCTLQNKEISGFLSRFSFLPSMPVCEPRKVFGMRAVVPVLCKVL